MGLLILCLFWKDLLKSLHLKTRNCFLCLLILKRLLIRYQVKSLILLWGKRVSWNTWYMVLCQCIRVVKLSQIKWNYQIIFLWILEFIKGQPKLTVICHYNGCFDRRCEGWFSDGVVVCRWSCSIWELWELY